MATNKDKWSALVKQRIIDKISNDKDKYLKIKDKKGPHADFQKRFHNNTHV